jgi:hypothetical protein
MDVCSPNIKQKSYTCFDYHELVEIAKAFNSFIKTQNVCKTNVCTLRNPIDINSKTKKQLWKSIHDRLNNICDKEYCWIDLEFIKKISNKSLKNKLKLFTFKPSINSDVKSWLSTTDINNVLQQYQESNPSFFFLGALPSDFYKHVQFNYNSFTKSKYKSIGIVLNHDNHKQPGSHWVSVFIDKTRKTIEYFDSTGGKPNKNIKHFLKFLLRDVFNNGYVYKENKRKHQYENYACGIYSIFYIVQRLLGKTFDDITNNIIKDKDIIKYKSRFFIPKKI